MLSSAYSDHRNSLNISQNTADSQRVMASPAGSIHQDNIVRVWPVTVNQTNGHLPATFTQHVLEAGGLNFDQQGKLRPVVFANSTLVEESQVPFGAFAGWLSTPVHQRPPHPLADPPSQDYQINLSQNCIPSQLGRWKR